MDVQPVTLEGRHLRLEPLDVRHAADLLSAATPDVFTYSILGPKEYTVPAFEEYITESLKVPARVAFAIVLKEEDTAIGTTSYHDITPAHRGLSIGYTWIARPHQGTCVNPESKYLMMRHAFEALGAIRVQFRADGRNIHSQRAIEKLGARREGTLRKHIILPDGYARDTAFFSVVDDEWPQVKAGLEQRLGYIP